MPLTAQEGLTALFRRHNLRVFFSYWRYYPLWVFILQPSSGAIASSRTRFLDHTYRRAAVGRTLWTRDQSVAETST